jgi:hypothetical protein
MALGEHRSGKSGPKPKKNDESNPNTGWHWKKTESRRNKDFSGLGTDILI